MTSLSLIDYSNCKLIKRDKTSAQYQVQPIAYHSINDNKCLGRFTVATHKDLPQLAELTECYGSNTVGVCRGETGAVVTCPLYISKDDHQHYPMALSSWGDLFCTRDHYDYLHIFTKLNHPIHRDWIDKTIKESIN